jgi:hypothetical protein
MTRKGRTGEYAVVAAASLIGLYLLTRKEGGETTVIPGATNTYKESILEKIGSGMGNAASDMGSNIIQSAGNAVGETVIGIPKKVVESSEKKTSDTTFGGQARTNVPAFFATGGERKVFTQPVTYQQFIQEQPLALRGASAAGNIITADYASKYGAYAAEETKKAAAVTEGVESMQKRYSQLTPMQQAFVGLGQAVTVPFGGGGAYGWGAATKKELSSLPVVGGWFS